MRLNQKKVGVALTFISEVIKMLTALFYTPVMLRLLGQSEYGLYQLSTSTISHLSLLSLGFVNAYFRYYSRYNVKGDTKGVARLNGMFMLIFSVISVMCLVFGAVMVAYADSIFGEGLTPDELVKSKALMAILVVNMAVTLFNSVFYCYIMACEKFIFQKLLNVIKNFLNPFITLPLLLLGYGSTAMVIVTTILTITVFVANIAFCRKKLQMHFSFHGLQFAVLKEMSAFTFFLFLNQIVNQVNWSIDKLLLGRMNGTEAVAVYGIGMQIYWLYFDIASSISGVFIPQINNIVAESNDNDRLTKLMTKVGRVQFLLLALILSGFIFFGQAFVWLWAGEGYEESFWVALMLIIGMTVPLIQNLGVEIQRAKNKHQIRSIVYTCIAVINIGLSIVFIRLWGCVGAAFGTLVSLIAGEVLFANWYYHKKIGLNMFAYWKEIFRLFPAILLVCLFGLVYRFFVSITGWSTLLVSILAFTVVYVTVMWFAGMNEYEKQLVRGMLSKFLRKNSKNS